MVRGESSVGATPSPSLLFCYTRVQSFVAFLLQEVIGADAGKSK